MTCDRLALCIGYILSVNAFPSVCPIFWTFMTQFDFSVFIKHATHTHTHMGNCSARLRQSSTKKRPHAFHETYTHTHTHTHTHMRTQKHIQLQTHTHARMHTRTHTEATHTHLCKGHLQCTLAPVRQHRKPLCCVCLVPCGGPHRTDEAGQGKHGLVGKQNLCVACVCVCASVSWHMCVYVFVIIGLSYVVIWCID
jgi:hypothetical protein